MLYNCLQSKNIHVIIACARNFAQMHSGIYGCAHNIKWSTKVSTRDVPIIPKKSIDASPAGQPEQTRSQGTYSYHQSLIDMFHFLSTRSAVSVSKCGARHIFTSHMRTPRQLPKAVRHLHANWSYLLNNVWLYKNGGKDNNSNRIGRGYVDGIYESDSPSDDLDTPSVLFLHDAYADHQQCVELARQVIEATSYEKAKNGERVAADVSKVQCLMVDVRGCGGSDGDDYAAPHTIQNAAEDVLTLVQSACAFPYTKQPFIVVAYGSLGKALAHYYADWTVNQGGVTSNTHSEVSGEGAVIPPEHIILFNAPPANSKSNINGNMTKKVVESTFDRAICDEMVVDGVKYLAQQHNTFQRVADDSLRKAADKKADHGRKPLQVVECRDYDSVIGYVQHCVEGTN